jgi:hypothetical protein
VRWFDWFRGFGNRFRKDLVMVNLENVLQGFARYHLLFNVIHLFIISRCNLFLETLLCLSLGDKGICAEGHRQLHSAFICPFEIL